MADRPAGGVEQSEGSKDLVLRRPRANAMEHRDICQHCRGVIFRRIYRPQEMARRARSWDPRFFDAFETIFAADIERRFGAADRAIADACRQLTIARTAKAPTGCGRSPIAALIGEAIGSN